MGLYVVHDLPIPPLDIEECVCGLDLHVMSLVSSCSWAKLIDCIIDFGLNICTQAQISSIYL